MKNKFFFSKFFIFQVNIQIRNFEFDFEIFENFVKNIKMLFFGLVFDTEKFGFKFFPKFKIFGFFSNQVQDQTIAKDLKSTRHVSDLGFSLPWTSPWFLVPGTPVLKLLEHFRLEHI